jgi:hypothetical protein
MGARAVRGRSKWSDWGSDTWDIEMPAFDKASLYQKMVLRVNSLAKGVIARSKAAIALPSELV